MRSSHADYFNHDEDAADYDKDVRNERDPIRRGYEEVLSWVTEVADVGGDSLGSSWGGHREYRSQSQSSVVEGLEEEFFWPRRLGASVELW